MSEIKNFTGKQTIGEFLRAIISDMADQGCGAVEMEVDIAGKTVAFNLEITSIKDANELHE